VKEEQGVVVKRHFGHIGVKTQRLERPWFIEVMENYLIQQIKGRLLDRRFKYGNSMMISIFHGLL
jgi:hypothetical protein